MRNLLCVDGASVGVSDCVLIDAWRRFFYVSREGGRISQARMRPGERAPAQPLRVDEGALLYEFADRSYRVQSCVAWKVSQLATCPDFSPFMNQRTRCSEEPWVNASGTT